MTEPSVGVEGIEALKAAFAEDVAADRAFFDPKNPYRRVRASAALRFHVRQSLGVALTALEAAEKENDRLRHGVPNPGSIRFGIEAEPWEGNGPCMDCEGRSPYWHAPSDLWQQVMGTEGDQSYPPGFICPICFVIRAWRKGLFTDPMIWWTWTPTPSGFLPEGDFLNMRDERDAAEKERDRLRGAVEHGAGKLGTIIGDSL